MKAFLIILISAATMISIIILLVNLHFRCRVWWQAQILHRNRCTLLPENSSAVYKVIRHENALGMKTLTCGHVQCYHYCYLLCQMMHSTRHLLHLPFWAQIMVVIWCALLPELYQGNWDSLLVAVPDSRLKGCEFESWQKRRENFLLQN